MHRFFHVDRSKTLIPGQTLQLGPGGFSAFGATHAEALGLKSFDRMTAQEVREAVAEEVRVWNFPTRPSRLKCLFSCVSLRDAEAYIDALPPERGYNIIEILSTEFVTLDANWLAYECDYETRIKYMQRYWSGEISNHNPRQGSRRPPMLEALINFPALTGQLVFVGQRETAT